MSTNSATPSRPNPSAPLPETLLDARIAEGQLDQALTFLRDQRGIRPTYPIGRIHDFPAGKLCNQPDAFVRAVVAHPTSLTSKLGTARAPAPPNRAKMRVT
jgi:hypothetical protein